MSCCCGVRRVLDERPDVTLEIAGRGVLEHGLKDLSRGLGLDGAVRFLGHVTPVQRAVENSMAVVVPSLGEGFGMVALEAMERARPVIAASSAGSRISCATARRGLLVHPGTPSRSPRRCSRSRPIRRTRPRWGSRRAAGRSTIPELRCTERTEEVYRHWLDVRGGGALEDVPSAVPLAVANGSSR